MGERFKSKFFLSHSNFWFVPYRDRDNFPKYDDLFPIGVFPIGTEDCNQSASLWLLKSVFKRLICTLTRAHSSSRRARRRLRAPAWSSASTASLSASSSFSAVSLVRVMEKNKKYTNFILCDKKFLKLIQAGSVFDFKPRLGRRDGDVEFIFDLGDFTLDIIDFLNILFY